MKEKVIKQYTKLVSAREKNKVAGFTKEIEWQCFKLPGCMQSNEKRIYLIEGTFEGVMFREIE